MKAQILKIAGVKTEAEFYKKFPTEEAFMKKHGEELKKAQYGAYVAGQPEQAEQKPIMYNDLQQDMTARITGVSKQEKARQDMLASQQAIASSSSQGQGLGDILKSIDPKMISSAMSAMGSAKNGKKMKKAQGGAFVPTDPVTDLNYQMPSDGQPTGETGNFAFGGPGDLIPELNPKNQLKVPSAFSGKAKNVLGALAPQLGTIIGSIEQIEQNKKDIKRANQWADISQIASQAATSRPEQSRRRYVRPEDNLVTGANPLGKPSSLLAAQNGAEIQNTYSPGDLYSDLGYEPLNDSNPKQYVHGGQLHKAAAGFDFNLFSGVGGGIGGVLGSKIGGGTGRGGPGSTIGSTALGAIGNAFLPGVGGLIGSFAGGAIGGLFDANDQNQLQAAQDRQAVAMNQGVLGTGINRIQQQNRAVVRNGGEFNSYENGGWMNPEYNPQVIAKFGEYDVKDLLKPPHDADMLRAGGHLKEYTPPSERAMYTGRDLPYQMEDGGQLAMGGDLQVHRGQAETLSYNPFLPDGGETIMFRGPSHDNGGMPISFGENGVEVEGGEPAVKLQDGGSPDGNLVVFGNMVIPEYGVAELGDKNAKGKKFKHYVDDLSKIEAKQNKLVDKTTQLINDVDVNDQFDKLTLNTGQANLIGTSMKLKDIAEKKKTAAAVQNAILDTASEMGLESDALAKGKIKYAKANDPYAKFGTKLKKAQDGEEVKYDPEFENFIDQAMQLEQDNSSQAGDYRGGGSNFGTNESDIDTREKAKEFYYNNYWSKIKDLPPGLRTRALQMAINTGDPYGELLVAGKQMSVDKRREAVEDAKKLGLDKLEKNKYIQSRRVKENQKQIDKVVEDYKKDPQGFLANLDAEQNRYYDSLVAANTDKKTGLAFKAINPDTVREFYDDYMGMARYASQPYISTNQTATTPAKVAATSAVPSSAIGSPLEGAVNLSRIAETLPDSYLSEMSAKPKQAAQASSNLGFDIRKFLPKELMPPKADPIEVPYATTYSQWDPEVGAYVPPAVVNAKTIKPVQPPVTPPLAPASKDDVKIEKAKGTFPWDTLLLGANSVLPFVRPTNQLPLDPSQLAGEIYAMSQNQEEPVFAQSYQPMLSQPISISLQDQLNEITSQARSAERMAQGNPAALAMIASQAAEAKNKVLGEQFRMNQGEAQRVAEGNRQTINEAAKMNLGLFDQQQDRAAKARSATKLQNIGILNSISDKIAKNRLENRQIGLMENLYNYRFSPSGVAYNLNPLAQFNMAGTGKGTDGVAPSGYEFETILKKKKTSKDDDTVTARNGSIVKAIKGL